MLSRVRLVKLLKKINNHKKVPGGGWKGEWIMLKIKTTVLLFFLLAGSAAGDWEMNEFMIYIGWPNGVRCPDSEALTKTLAEADFNTVMWDKGKLELCRKYGLKLVVTDVKPEDIGQLAKDPVLWGYHILDEPRLKQFDDMAKKVKAFRKADPEHPGYVNMYSWGSDFLREYMDTVHPMILSYDWYQWWWGTEMHYSRLEQYREGAMLEGVPLICWQEVNSNPNVEWGGDSTRPDDNLAKLHLSVYTSLAYGVKGIEWFVAGIMFNKGTNELNECGKDVAAINAELKKLGPILIKLRSVNVYNTKPLPRGTREAPPDHWYQITGEEGGAGFVYGMFVDDKGVDYIFVVNRNYQHAQQADVVIQQRWKDVPGVDSIARFDMNENKWRDIPRANTWFSFNVPPADGVLLKIQRSLKEKKK